MDLRERIPTRRFDPKSVSDYHQYKEDLREDFKCRCGYCNDHDYFRTTDYQIDHFVSRTQMKRIELTDYSNLVYSCRSCNNSKRAKWPTGNATSGSIQKAFGQTPPFAAPSIPGSSHYFSQDWLSPFCMRRYQHN